MRLTTMSTWLRLALLLAAYILIPLSVQYWNRLFTTQTDSGGPIIMSILLVLPLITLVLSAWDGLKEGFSVLWQLAPFVFFLFPTYLILNDSALIYGVIYAVIGLTGNGIASLFYIRNTTTRH